MTTLNSFRGPCALLGILLYLFIFPFAFAEDTKIWFEGKVYLIKVKYSDIITNNGTIDELDASKIKKAIKTHCYEVKSVKFPVLKTQKNKFVVPYIFFHRIPFTSSDNFYFLMINCHMKEKCPVSGIITMSPILYEGHFLKSAVENADKVYVDSFALFKYTPNMPFLKKDFPFPAIYEDMNIYGNLCRVSSCDIKHFVPVCKCLHKSVVTLSGFVSYSKDKNYFLKSFGCFRAPFYKEVVKKINIPLQKIGQAYPPDKIRDLIEERLNLDNFKVEPQAIFPTALLEIKLSSEGVPIYVLGIMNEAPIRFKREIDPESKAIKKVLFSVEKDDEVNIMILEANVINR